MNGIQARVPAGVPTGGRFATTGRAEANLSLDASESRTVAPSTDVIDKSLAMSGLDLTEAVCDYSREEMRGAFVVGHDMGMAASRAAHPSTGQTLVVAREIHRRECGACHGADLNCIQVEETFMPVARGLLDLARNTA